jgi:hypothetical protein
MAAGVSRGDMASTLVHVALAGLLAAGLLGDAFDRGSVLVVLGATALVDADAFLGLVVEGTHRAAFHTVLLPAAMAALAYYDLQVREESWLRRWRPDAGRVAGVTVLAVAVAAIGLDMVINGVNAFYPLHDQFYTVDGKALLSNQRGFVQTFVELEPETNAAAGTTEVKTTGDEHYSTGVDPQKGSEPADVERTFFLVGSGERLLLAVTGYAVVVARFWERSDVGLSGIRSRL